jgi:YidC/Oxa1 family membrane protein insertase
MQKRFVIFLALSAAIFLAWQLAVEKLYPNPAKNAQQKTVSTETPPGPPGPSGPMTPVVQADGSTTAPVPGSGAAGKTAAQARAQAAAVAQRQIRIRTDLWDGVVSNKGGVLTQWIMTRFTDGKPIDPPNGVSLVSERLGEFGFPLRLAIPADRELEKELNSANYEIESLPGDEIALARNQTQEIVFTYRRENLVATKKIVFNGSGYDFDFQVDVKRGEQAIPVSVVIGPNFGDHAIKEYGYYKPTPEVSYSLNGSVKRETASGSKTDDPKVIDKDEPIRWVSVDDNYFAMALVPSAAARSITVVDIHRKEKIDNKEQDRTYISTGIPVTDKPSHIYAGPKDPATLEQISIKFGLGDGKGNLEDLVNYGYLSAIVKPLARLMLRGLQLTNVVTHNYGWAIVVLTIVLNMFFFPLRWKSSVSMKRAAVMQPKMKELQERMKKVDKNDPRYADLQKEQIALMRQGNPLMGCLPLLIQLPFFYAVFTILTIAIEVRHAHFFGWITDLSSPDAYYILPIVMCVTMIAQTALTPTTGDPMQKRMGYIMPLLFTVLFFKAAPAGLVLYWMVGNLVGIVQQFVINKMSPPVAPAASVPSTPQKPAPRAKGKKSKQLLADS